MADVHPYKVRSYNMSRVKSKGTRPELVVRKWLWCHGFRYRLNVGQLPGKPDICFPGKKKVIFVNGCFWHKHNCKKFSWPKTRDEFWRKKITSNVVRDQVNYASLSELGWDFLVIWECQIKTGINDNIAEVINQFLNE